MLKSIQITDLSYSYPGEKSPALKQISTTIPSGSTVALLGNNGSGKTTLLLSILGRIHPEIGSIQFHNNNGPFKDHLRIGYLPQIEELPNGFTVEEYILLGRFQHINHFGMPGDDDYFVLNQKMESNQVDQFRNRKIAELSGGELQKIRLTRTMVQEPDIFLFDEPANHLDLKNRQELLQSIDHLENERNIILFTTHNPNDAMKIANYVILLKNGGIIAQGNTEKVLNKENLEETFEMRIDIIEHKDQRLIISEE